MDSPVVAQRGCCTSNCVPAHPDLSRVPSLFPQPEERERHRCEEICPLGVATDAEDRMEHDEDEAVENQGKGWDRKAASCEYAPMEQRIGMRGQGIVRPLH